MNSDVALLHLIRGRHAEAESLLKGIASVYYRRGFLLLARSLPGGEEHRLITAARDGTS
jgi:hypothetical protein